MTAIEGRADHFTLLHVPRNAEPLQIRDAYFRLAKLVHPDQPQFSGNPELRAHATRAFQAITAANATLSDPIKRNAYIQSMLVAAMDRSSDMSARMQTAARQTAPVATSLRPSGPQPHAVDVVVTRGRGSSPQTPTGLTTATRATVPGASVEVTGSFARGLTTSQVPLAGPSLSTTGQFNRTVLSGQQAIGPQNVAATAQFARPVLTGQHPVMSATGQFARPTGQIPQNVAGPTHRPTPSGQAIMGPTTSPSSQSRPVQNTRGLEPPPNAEVARIYLHSGRQQLTRRDWQGAQEALELALPLLEKNEAADCKVTLGWAIFNNNANPEIDRIERPKAMWNEVATQFAKTPYHAQAAYYLAIWHKLHGELRHVMNNLQVCLDLQPNHIEAAREKRLMEQRRSNLAEMQELEQREREMKSRRSSKSAVPASPASPPTPGAGSATVKKVALKKEASWLEKLFGGEKK